MERRNFLASLAAFLVVPLVPFKRKKKRPRQILYYFHYFHSDGTLANHYPSQFLPLENSEGPIALNMRWIDSVSIDADKATIFLRDDKNPLVFRKDIDRIEKYCEEKYKFGRENPEQIVKPTKYVGERLLDIDDHNYFNGAIPIEYFYPGGNYSNIQGGLIDPKKPIWGKQGEWTLYKTS